MGATARKVTTGADASFQQQTPPLPFVGLAMAPDRSRHTAWTGNRAPRRARASRPATPPPLRMTWRAALGLNTRPLAIEGARLLLARLTNCR